MTKIERAALLECLAAVESMSALFSISNINLSSESFYNRMAVISNSTHGLMMALNNESAGGSSVEVAE